MTSIDPLAVILRVAVTNVENGKKPTIPRELIEQRITNYVR